MQLMPETAKRYGVKNRLDPAQNISGGARYLRDLIRMFNNDVQLAVAAYNAGENAVVMAGKPHPALRGNHDLRAPGHVVLQEIPHHLLGFAFRTPASAFFRRMRMGGMSPIMRFFSARTCRRTTMKIEKIETTVLRIPYTSGGPSDTQVWGGKAWQTADVLLVKISTDTGVTGWGEAFGYNVIPATEGRHRPDPRADVHRPIRWQSKR